MNTSLIAGLIPSIVGILLIIDLVTDAHLYIRFHGWMARSQPLPGHRREMVSAMYAKALLQQSRGESVVLSTWTEHYYLPEFAQVNRKLQWLVSSVALTIGGLTILDYVFSWGG